MFTRISFLARFDKREQALEQPIQTIDEDGMWTSEMDEGQYFWDEGIYFLVFSSVSR